MENGLKATVAEVSVDADSGLARFVLEFFRGDLARGSVGVLSTSQFISVFTFFAGIVLLVQRRHAPSH